MNKYHILTSIIFCLATYIFVYFAITHFQTVTYVADTAQEPTDSQTSTQTEEISPSLVTKPPYTIRFVGDIMLGRNVEYLHSLHGTEYLVSGFQAFPTVDATIINFESAMAVPHRRTQPFTFQFSTSPDTLPVLTALRATHASLANNHGLDYGRAGYEQAMTELKNIGIESFGHPTIVSSSSIAYLDSPHGRVAIIGLHTLFTALPQDEVTSLLLEAATESDIQIIYIHWGTEYETVHTRDVERMATWLIEAGADIIVGHHPHVVQDIQLIDGVPVFYSLGNFIFDQYFSEAVQDGLVLDLTLEGDALIFTLIPVTSRAVRSQTRIMGDAERTVFLDTLAERSHPLLQPGIRVGQLEFAFPLATSP